MGDEFLRVVVHEEYAARMEADHDRFEARLKELEKKTEQNTQMLISIERLATNMEQMQKELKDQGERVEVLEARDGEMWRKAVGYLITAAIGAVVGFMFKQIGM